MLGLQYKGKRRVLVFFPLNSMIVSVAVMAGVATAYNPIGDSVACRWFWMLTGRGS